MDTGKNNKRKYEGKSGTGRFVKRQREQKQLNRESSGPPTSGLFAIHRSDT
nr:hypothetical protein [Brevibacillus laterosporus]